MDTVGVAVGLTVSIIGLFILSMAQVVLFIIYGGFHGPNVDGCGIGMWCIFDLIGFGMFSGGAASVVSQVIDGMRKH